MKIGITDSGVGGLSVCAEVEAGLRRHPVREDVEILYLNAALQDDYSYNSMTTRQEKLEAFDTFLGNVAERYQPDLLYIACNTLSVLFQDPYFDRHRQLPTLGIVASGTREMLLALEAEKEAAVIVFATPTTIEEGVYRRNLLEHGIDKNRIVQQACPGLPDAISNDFSGGLTAALLSEFVPAALAQFPVLPASVVAFLGCTHYGYQAAQFEKFLRKQVNRAEILNPNNAAADTILDQVPSLPGNGSMEIRFITPYAVPQKPLRSLSHYLGDRAPATTLALQHSNHDPSLYQTGTEEY